MMQIKKTMERVPGGLMVVPLLLGALCNTFFPDTPKIFGSFTGGLFTGATSILAVYYVCMGATISFKTTPYIIKKGGALFIAKVGIAAVIGIVAARFLGEGSVTNGFFAGVSTLAIVAALNDTNGGLYMALMGQYGKPRDVAAYSIMCLESGPFLTMVTLGVAGLSAFPWQMMVGAIFPLVLGMVLGNLDKDMRDFLKAAPAVLIPFFAFALGAGLDLSKVWSAGLLGVGMGICVVVITGFTLFVADRLTGGTGVAGLAASSTAGNAAAVPMIIAQANPAYAPVAQYATVLVASCVVVTAILTPFVTAWGVKVFGAPKDLPDEEDSAVSVQAGEA